MALPAGHRGRRAGCAPSTPWCRRCCGRSARTILVSQHGCDTHRLDPLANLELSIDAQRVAHAAIHQLAHEVAGGRWLLTGGGGYELLQVVPRTWTHLLAEAAGHPDRPGCAHPRRLARVRVPADRPPGSARP